MTIKVLFAHPDRDPEVREIENDLKPMQELVEGLIECVPLGNGDIIICNEEGLIHGMKPNFALANGTAIVGPAFFCKEEGEDFASLPQDAIEYYTNFLLKGGNRAR